LALTTNSNLRLQWMEQEQFEDLKRQAEVEGHWFTDHPNERPEIDAELIDANDNSLGENRLHTLEMPNGQWDSEPQSRNAHRVSM